MIAVDTSALVAIMMGEPEAEQFRNVLLAAERSIISTPTALELHLAMSSKLGEVGRRRAGDMVRSELLTVIEWTPDHLAIAVQAFEIYGKGQHPAKLNFGDCMVYAVAKALDVPLLYKGNDFFQTDIRSAL